MASAKHIEVVGALAKVETTYNTYASPVTTSDGVQLIKPRPEATTNWLYDGSGRRQAGAYGATQRPAPSGRWVSTSLKVEGKGNGSAYTSASVTVPHIHALLRMAGFDATLNGTTAWTFAPTVATSAPASGSVALYGQGELWQLAGCYANLKWTADGEGIPVWEFPINGTMATDPSDVTLPTITYHSQTVIPPTATGISFTLGSFTSNAIVKSIDFDLGRDISTARASLGSSAGHAGFAPGQRTPSAKIVLEATALQTTPFTAAAGFDPYSLWKAATTFACSWQVGSTQYNRYKFDLGSLCQVTNVALQDEGPVALVEMTVEPHASSQTAVDDVTITFT